MRDDGVVHVLVEERLGAESIQRHSIGSAQAVSIFGHLKKPSISPENEYISLPPSLSSERASWARKPPRELDTLRGDGNKHDTGTKNKKNPQFQRIELCFLGDDLVDNRC